MYWLIEHIDNNSMFIGNINYLRNINLSHLQMNVFLSMCVCVCCKLPTYVNVFPTCIINLHVYVTSSPMYVLFIFFFFLF